ncbi:MAG: glycosyltransferase, partial [Chloroflexi bacterium]|nr:glycosyltransferase [Chloroflexota bacterium]
QAFAALHQKIPAAYLIIVGGGTLYDQLSEQVAALKLEKHTQLLGARTDVPRLLAASDIYVNASHREGLPLAILEAMSAGLPVVATGVGGVPELVGGRGILVPPRRPEAFTAALVSLLNDPARQRSLGMAARAHVNHHYAPSPWFEQILAVYQEVKRENVKRDTVPEA